MYAPAILMKSGGVTGEDGTMGDGQAQHGALSVSYRHNFLDFRLYLRQSSVSEICLKQIQTLI